MVGLIVAAIISVVVGTIAFLWADRISHMKEKHPKYKDFIPKQND